ncbi:ribosomal RNA small subunit methyltransferase, mitochondrial [Benincasa hispida]|uniref:ribosomal RNA small subunit methyltransferase, mitochondrial n=1 Tax=Benincasa hispida TaxID=102211 RepID=UPI0019027086|nr:ribosomal RNA small subunit methyltransferase, mitochondrial [Benincasa hispida]
MLRPHKNLCRFIYGLSHHQSLHCIRSASTYQHNQRNHGAKGNVRKKDENEEAHLYFYKSRGQHILMNQRILDSIVRKSAILRTDTVLEIGPGTGNLTLKLLEASQKVIAVEIDKRMVEVLHRRVAEHQYEDRICVICQDALKCEFPRFDLVVANIPYGISSPLVAKLVYGTIPFRSATLLLQKEFARRLLADPGDSEYNRLAVNVKLVADVEHVMDVSKRDFVPCPKVDSSVVIIRPKKEVPDVNLEEWRAFTRTCFGKKNKTLGATFKQKKKLMDLMHSNSENGYNSFKEMVIQVLKSGDFEDKRPVKLCNDELLHLLALFNQAGVYFHDGSKLQDAERGVLAHAYSSELEE